MNKQFTKDEIQMVNMKKKTFKLTSNRRKVN